MIKSTLLSALIACTIALPVNAKDEASIGIQKLEHVALVTTDYERIVTWYKDVLDFEVETEWKAPEVVPDMQLNYMVHSSGVRLEIVGGKPAQATSKIVDTIADDFKIVGIRHFALTVDSVDEAFAYATERGAKILAKPFDYLPLKKRLAFIQDPDGNAIEFVEILD